MVVPGVRLLAADPRVLAIAVVAGLIVVSAFAPTPQNWGKPADERVHDVTVTAVASWRGGIIEGWSIGEPAVEDADARWFNVRAIFQNALAFFGGSPPREMTFTLEHSGGFYTRTLTESTLEGGRVFDHEETHTVVFTEAPTGPYRLTVTIQDDAGLVLAERITQLTIGGN